MCRLCTPPRAVGHVAARWPRVPPVGWLRGGRSLKQTKAENDVGVPQLALSQDFRKFAKKSKAGADQENFSKMSGVAEKKPGIFAIL